ncbi:Bug family tripartite tricarboxylate transporter substrate binding protein [Salinarimonas ramus]|uniref:Tripartite-type tricarboxylate transporter, receptor component TctC n=1 Tax=Salinarimonas ramus TaxID=690164 RepID=A0A917Q479_9HYPH|nr:tripartite tricarboxylate transporter substrate binding protein [Salinarimonas ramus]GGK20441.1 hypothetical protein GCM10011322_03880 [Salinarimonas ramus]
MKTMIGAALALAIGGSAAFAQSYPTGTVTIVVPYAPGGIADIAARTVAEALTQKWGQQVIVDNRTGGAGFIAATSVLQEPRDGHTLFVADAGVMAINPSLFEDIPYDPAADFQPITMISDTPLVLVANADAPFDTTAEYVEHARENPGELVFASAGIGSLNHIVPEWINAETGIDVEHVPYRGGAPAAAAVASGEADVGVLALSSVGAFVDSGDLKILGLARTERVDTHPDVPTLAEGGVENVAAGQWAGLFAPTGVPEDVVRKIHADTVAFLETDAARDTFRQRGAFVVPMEMEAFASDLSDLRERLGAVIRDADIRPN